MAEAARGLLAIALRARCPRCGKGALFRGLLTVRDRCEVCGLDLRACDTGDGAAFAVMLVLGTILVGLAFWVEFHFNPPLWVHAVLWPLLAFPAAIAMLRPLKAALVAQQYRVRSTELGS
jgi:uncharacterized protein (DUF983 family)